MNREELEAYILNHHSTEPDYPWADTPRAAVFRHASNRKWFALVTEVPRDKLGLVSNAQGCWAMLLTMPSTPAEFQEMTL